MAVIIRMKRMGRRNRPTYRISVCEQSVPTDGRVLDSLGHYDPASPVPDLRLKLDVERAREWVVKGARASPTVHSIFKKSGVYEGVPAPKPRKKRTGRGKATATKAHRVARKSARDEAKGARRSARVAAKRAAAKAAAAAAAPEA